MSPDKKLLEKFKWNPGNTLPETVVRVPMEPYVEPVPACTECGDRGWIAIPDETVLRFPGRPASPGRVMNCPACNSPARNAIKRCAQVSGLTLDSPNAPTLATFKPHDDASERMLDAALDFVENPHGWLTMHGAGKGRNERGAGHWGAGKSHLGEAITRALWAKQVPALFITTDRLMAHLGAGWRDEGDDVDYERRLVWVQHLPVLVLDEMNKESPSPSVERMRLQVLDTRYRHIIREEGGATVFLSNDDPRYWQDPAIGDRVRDTRFVQVQVTPVSFRQVQR